MIISQNHDVLTAADLRRALEQLSAAVTAPKAGTDHYIIVHPIDTRMHILIDWWWAMKQFVRTWNNRTDYERMDGLAWLVRGLFDQV